MPKFFYGIIFSVVLLLLLYTFTKPSDKDPSSTEDLATTEDSSEDISEKKTILLSFQMLGMVDLIREKQV